MTDELKQENKYEEFSRHDKKVFIGLATLLAAGIAWHYYNHYQQQHAFDDNYELKYKVGQQK